MVIDVEEGGESEAVLGLRRKWDDDEEEEEDDSACVSLGRYLYIVSMD